MIVLTRFPPTEVLARIVMLFETVISCWLYVPGFRTMVLPEAAELIAAWIESPGLSVRMAAADSIEIIISPTPAGSGAV
jgi:hypothetical protein